LLLPFGDVTFRKKNKGNALEGDINDKIP